MEESQLRQVMLGKLRDQTLPRDASFANTIKSDEDPNGMKIVVTSCLRGIEGRCGSRVTSYCRERPMSQPTPSNTDAIQLTATR